MRLKTRSAMEFPKARNSDLLTEEIDGELLIFDVLSNRAHCLNRSAAAIWQHCDGSRSLGALATHLFPALERTEGEQLVRVGVERLRRRRLLEDSTVEPMVDLSKRHMIKKMAMMAAAAGIAAPIVSSVLAPTPAYAVSCLPRGMVCSSGVNCCSGSCVVMVCQ
jgi:Coenzyme PQQ synthesis protein D (PqqD)